MLAETGAAKVDLVGHSEGGFQTLYVTKTQGISSRIDKVVAIAPPTHGTSFAGLYNLAYLFGGRGTVDTVLKRFGCPACTDLGPDGDAVKVLTDGPIAQPGVDYTIITSRYDELVTRPRRRSSASPASRISMCRTSARSTRLGTSVRHTTSTCGTWCPTLWTRPTRAGSSAHSAHRADLR